MKTHKWIPVEEKLPKERQVVAVMVKGSALPFCAYLRVWSENKFFVVYGVTNQISTDVIAWCDCIAEGYEDFKQM